MRYLYTDCCDMTSVWTEEGRIGEIYEIDASLDIYCLSIVDVDDPNTGVLTLRNQIDDATGLAVNYTGTHDECIVKAKAWAHYHKV